MSKRKQQVDDAERLQALKRSGLVDTPLEKSFDRLTQLASKILDAPVSLVSLVEVDRQFFKSQIGLSEPWASKRETPISHSFCQHVVTSGDPLIIDDATQHPLVCENPAILELDVVSYLGIPLTSPDGWRLGSFCIIDNKPRHWSEHEIDIMKTLADSVMTEIHLRLEAKARDEAIEDLHRLNQELDAYAHTVSHNLKNPISAIVGWCSLSTEYADRMSSDDMFETVTKIRETATYANDIINALMLLAGVGRVTDIPIQELSMFNIIDDALSRLQRQIAASRAEIILPSADTFPHSYGYRPWVEEVWVNYISNAIKYGGKPPRIEFGAEASHDGYVRYWIKDNGGGLLPEQYEQLFIPFSRLPHTAKIEGHGLGLSIVQRIVDRLHGEVGVSGEPGQGSVFSFTLPAHPTP